MIAPGTGVRVYLACGVTDMRKGINGLSALAQNVLRQKPTGGAAFAFRGRRGDRIKLLYWDGQKFCKRYVQTVRVSASRWFESPWHEIVDVARWVA
jgi:transposase